MFSFFKKLFLRRKFKQLRTAVECQKFMESYSRPDVSFRDYFSKKFKEVQK